MSIDAIVHYGDCIMGMSEKIKDESIDLMVSSIPFSSLFTYSGKIDDIGNNLDGVESHAGQFGLHFRFFLDQLYRVMKPGSIASIHVQQLLSWKVQHGYMGMRDFRGAIITLFKNHGWQPHGEVAIPKDPRAVARRLNLHSLMFATAYKNARMLAPAMNDYVLFFRKPGEGVPCRALIEANREIKLVEPSPIIDYSQNQKKVVPGYQSIPYDIETWTEKTGTQVKTVTGGKHINPDGWLTKNDWIDYANGVWTDIQEIDTLDGYKCAREKDDERHVCLAKGSLVLTIRGFIEIQDIEIGDTVLTHMGNWKPVLAKECTGVNETVQIHSQGVANLVLTPSHKIWARKVTSSKPKYSMKSHDPEWIEAKDALKSYINLKLPDVVESDLSEKEWWIVGRYLADGHQGDRLKSNGMKSFYISVGTGKDGHFLEMAGDNAGMFNVRSCNQYRLKGLNDNLQNILHRCGKGASNKQIPIEGLCLNNPKSEALLSGYLSGDGHKDKYGRWHCSSVSRPLLLGMAMVTQRARGIIPAVYASKDPGSHIIAGRTVNQKQLWVMMFNDNPKYTFSEILKDGAWKKTRKIEQVGKNETWSICVADDESYTAEGCIVKNCPLQLDVIRRCIKLHSSPGETVCDPFMGVGSTAYVAIEQGRNSIGFELKESYHQQALANVEKAKQKFGIVENNNLKQLSLV